VAEVPITLYGFSVLYLALGLALIFLLRALATGAPGEVAGPPAAGEQPARA
jgi:hypothetical protein